VNKNINISGKDNTINKEEYFTNDNFINISGNENDVFIGENCKLNKIRVTIIGNGCKLVIGNQCRINAGFQLKGEKSSVTIGDKTTIEGANIVALEGRSIAMGVDCMLSFNIEMRTSDAHSIIDLATNERINSAGDISIGNHVWVGARTILMKGSSVADNVIIGQGSLVNKRHTKSNCIIAGTPAIVRRSNINWDRKLI